MKRSVIIIICVLAGLMVLSVIKDAVVKISVEKGVELATGLRLSTGSFNVGIIRSIVKISGLKLYNPKGFEEKLMMDMPEIYVDYDIPAIMKGRVHLKELRIYLKEFNVVRNNKGELNLDSLNVVKEERARKTSGKSAERSKMPPIQIDVLRLKIDRASYKDYSLGGSPVIKEFRIDLDERYDNITDPYSLVSIIVVRSLANTNISGLANFDISGLKNTMSGTLLKTKEVAAKTLSTTTAKTAQAVEQAKQTAAKTAEELQNVFTNPFGGEAGK